MGKVDSAQPNQKDAIEVGSVKVRLAPGRKLSKWYRPVLCGEIAKGSFRTEDIRLLVAAMLEATDDPRCYDTVERLAIGLICGNNLFDRLLAINMALEGVYRAVEAILPTATDEEERKSLEKKFKEIRNGILEEQQIVMDLINEEEQERKCEKK